MGMVTLTLTFILDLFFKVMGSKLQEAWDANMVLQFVVDAYACIKYIVSYISKKESEEGELLKAAQKEAREGNADAVTELRQIGKAYLSNREISIMEAVYQIRGTNTLVSKCRS